MNKKFFRYYMDNKPETDEDKYLFLVDNLEIAFNIIASGYRAIFLADKDDETYFNIDSFIEVMDNIRLTGTHQCSYRYVSCLMYKWKNQRIEEGLTENGCKVIRGWQEFKEREYLGKPANQPEIAKRVKKFIRRFECDPKEDPDLSQFHKYDPKGKVVGVKDMVIVEHLLDTICFFVMGGIVYYYEGGVYKEDYNGVRLKYAIQKLIFKDNIQSNTIQRVYNLLITQPEVYKESYELNQQPAYWVNFKNGYYDVLEDKMIEHDPKYFTLNQIPFEFYPQAQSKVLEGGDNIKKYLATSIPSVEEQMMFWEYFGYCMTMDTQFQKFLMLRGNGGTGKSVAVSLIQYIVGHENASSISLQDLNKRFFATGLYGKLLNACADIPCKAMENTDVLKKAVGEDTLLYEKKGQDAIHFKSYAKLLFSTNEMPQNLEDKSDAFYRRLLILDMNQQVRSGVKDLHLKEKVQKESDYAIHMAMIALKGLYQRGAFTESDHSKECVKEIQKSSDSVCAFTEDVLMPSDGNRIKRSETFTKYEEYCKENDRQGHGKSKFFKLMAEKGYRLKQYNGEYYYQDTSFADDFFQPVGMDESIPFDNDINGYEQLKLNIEKDV